MADPIKLDPEVENSMGRLLNGFRDSLFDRIKTAEDNTRLQIHGVTLQNDAISRQMSAMQSDVAEVKREMKDQSRTLGEHTTAIAVIMQKLEEGEKRFEKNEAALEQTDDTLVTLLKRPQPGGVNIRQLGTGLAAGATIAAALARLWH